MALEYSREVIMELGMQNSKATNKEQLLLGLKLRNSNNLLPFSTLGGLHGGIESWSIYPKKARNLPWSV